MIRDAKGHKWFMRFKQYREGWNWDACNYDGGGGITSFKLFPTKAGPMLAAPFKAAIMSRTRRNLPVA